jgi:Ni,Fe-hydrogenase III small subunit/Pyruvate/2-oxoacid:ferredoxin oxidoreductase delta subunit
MPFPDGPPPELPARFRGRPEIDAGLCRSACRACAEACPTQAITGGELVQIDLGRCLFCSDCVEACPQGAISFTNDYRLAVGRREGLVVRGNQAALPLAAELGAELRRLLGRSLKLRQVSAGGCNGCELDTNVLNTVGWDLGRFGVQFVASPRHADGLLITGAVSKNMKLALQKTYDAIPAPKIVIGVGACAIGGGPFIGHAEVNDGATDLLPIDLLIPGCPPHPLTILDGILRLLGRVDGGKPRPSPANEYPGR